MAETDLVAYVKANLAQFGEKALREQLQKDGVPQKDIDDAFLVTATKARPRRRMAKVALAAGALLLVLAVLMSMETPKSTPKDDEVKEEDRDPVYRGHYGYIFKLPLGYRAYGTFQDPRKTQELVYIYPKGTDHSHFIHEGLYGNLGIMRLEAVPRRVPQGFVGIDTLQAFVKHKLEMEKSTYKMRRLIVHGMPAFIVNTEKPFKGTRAYIIGQKIRYTLVSGEENTLFTNVLSSLVEATPHDRPGR